MLLGIASPSPLLEHGEYNLVALGVALDQVDDARVVHAPRLALLAHG